MNKVQDHYDQSAEQEWQRLLNHRTEFAVTMKALREFLPPPPAKIADIGGGPGRYAISLSKDGYSVTLFDLSKLSLDLARKKSKEANVEIVEFIHLDARDLSGIEDDVFDNVLLLGPLYHLQKKKDRINAIVEARRVLRSGGLIFAAFITRFAPFRHAASEDPEWLISNYEYAFELLETGEHVKAKAFPSAYFAHPDEIDTLTAECNIQKVALMGCEGIVAGHERLVNEFEGEDWEKWVELNYRLGQDPSLYGASDHMLYVGKKSA